MNNQITFNSKTSPCAGAKSDFNRMFIVQQEHYFNALLKIRGYLYLNTIYEALGVEWDTEWENCCLLYKPGTRLTLAIRGVNDDGFDIEIL